MIDPRTLPPAARVRFEAALRQAAAQYPGDTAKAEELAAKSIELAGWTKQGEVWIAKARFELRADGGWRARVPITKIAEDERLAFGWSSIVVTKTGQIVIDHHSDVIRVSELERAAYGYVMRSRDATDQHGARGVATLIESCVFTPEKRIALGLPIDSGPTGWWVGFKVLDASVWSRVKSGELGELSIGGNGRRRKLSPEEVGDAVRAQ